MKGDFNEQHYKFLQKRNNYIYYRLEVNLSTAESYDLFYKFLSEIEYIPNYFIEYINCK